MTEQATKKNTHSLTGLHSLQSLGWGAVAMNQLAQLINWSGDDSFKPVAVDPWTALISINSDPIGASATSAAETTSPITSTSSEPLLDITAVETPSPTEAELAAAESERVAAESASAEKLAAEKLAAEKLAAEKLAAEKLAAEKLAAEKLAAEKLAAEKLAAETAAEKLAAENIAAQKLAAEKVAEEQAAADARDKAEAKRLAVAAAEQAAIEKEKEAVKAATERALAIEEAAAEKLAAEQAANEQKVAEQKAAEKKAAEQKAAEMKAAEQRTAEQKAARQEPRPPNEVEEPKTQATKSVATNSQPVVRPVSQSPRTSVPATARTAILAQVPTSIQRPISADSSVEAYLAQLEQLVLELNMELGRRDQTASDPIHDLSQRIIDLNLENLALKEQLRKSSSHE